MEDGISLGINMLKFTVVAPVTMYGSSDTLNNGLCFPDCRRALHVKNTTSCPGVEFCNPRRTFPILYVLVFFLIK